MMERIYYSINEKDAKTAHNMMSFSDYKTGSKTEEYKGYVDQAYDLADEIAKAKPDCTERIYNMADRYAKKMAEYFNKDSRIGCMCPSVLISGAGNFPVKKKEKQNQAWERNHKFFDEIQEILKKMESILYGSEMIMSGDEDAVEKLEDKLEKLKAEQENMKSANKGIRMKNVEKGNKLLEVMGFTQEQIKSLRTPDYCGRIGYPDYLLRNNNANIHRIETRLKNLKSVKERGTSEVENQFFRVVENTELMRLQLFFESKPEQKVRDILKSNGFKWTPSQSAWQRQLTNNSRYALEQVINQLKKLQETEGYSM